MIHNIPRTAKSRLDAQRRQERSFIFFRFHYSNMHKIVMTVQTNHWYYHQDMACLSWLIFVVNFWLSFFQMLIKSVSRSLSLYLAFSFVLWIFFDTVTVFHLNCTNCYITLLKARMGLCMYACMIKIRYTIASSLNWRWNYIFWKKNNRNNLNVFRSMNMRTRTNVCLSRKYTTEINFVF